MKKIFFALLIPFALQAQVGINTTEPDNSSMLDIKANDKGILIPRVSIPNLNASAPVTSPTKSLLVYNTDTTTGEGFYYWDTTKWTPLSDGKSNWTPNGTNLYNNNISGNVGIGTTNPTVKLDIEGKLIVRNLPSQDATKSTILTTDENGNIGKLNSYYLSDMNSVKATVPIDVNVTNSETVSNLDLGISTTVYIPANKKARITIGYSVPIGTTSFGTTPNGYYGIKFIKDNVEADAGSRKFTIPNPNMTTVSNMITVSNIYVEDIEAITTDRNITYKLFGYVEQYDNGTGTNTYRFNMWNATGSNYNWGKATMTKQVFLQ